MFLGSSFFSSLVPDMYWSPCSSFPSLTHLQQTIMISLKLQCSLAQKPSVSFSAHIINLFTSTYSFLKLILIYLQAFSPSNYSFVWIWPSSPNSQLLGTFPSLSYSYPICLPVPRKAWSPHVLTKTLLMICGMETLLNHPSQQSFLTMEGLNSTVLYFTSGTCHIGYIQTSVL